MSALEYHVGQRGWPGWTVSFSGTSGTVRGVLPAMGLADSTGKEVNFSAPVSLGRFTLTADTSGTDNDLATLLTAGTPSGDLSALIASGLSAMLVTVETNDVRVAFDNTDPSSNGLLYGKGNTQPYVWDCSDFTKVKIAGQGGSATLRVALFR